MTLTTIDCNSIVFNSDLFLEATNSLLTNNPVIEIRIKGSINCCGEKFNKVVFPPNGYLPRTADTIFPSDFDPIWTLFEGGVYQITFELKYSNGQIKTDSGCVFIPCDITCKIANAILKDFKSETYLKYDLLLNANNCGDCNCDRMCALFEQLKKELPINHTCNGCGCKKCDNCSKCKGCSNGSCNVPTYQDCPTQCNCQGLPINQVNQPCSSC